MSVLAWIVGRLGTWLWPVVGVAALGMLATIGWLNYRVDDLKEDLLVQGAQFNEERLLASRARAADEKRERDLETARRHDQQEKLDAAEETAARARADLAIADAAAGRLRGRIEALIADARRQTSGGAAPGQASPPAGDATAMLADVLGRCVARVRLLAAVADERGAAGQLCEQFYDALTP